LPRGAVTAGVLATASSGCASEAGPARVEPEHVVYDGEAYGDFVVLAEAVRDCKDSEVRTLPRIVLVDELFDCHTTQGWKKALGCTGEGQSVMVADAVVASRGALWSHELVHYLGTKAEGDPCATLSIEGFSLDL
jgi:hypothetical protein